MLSTGGSRNKKLVSLCADENELVVDIKESMPPLSVPVRRARSHTADDVWMWLKTETTTVNSMLMTEVDKGELSTVLVEKLCKLKGKIKALEAFVNMNPVVAVGEVPVPRLPTETWSLVARSRDGSPQGKDVV